MSRPKTYYHDEQTEVDPLDLQSVILEFGGVWRSAFERVDIIPSVSYTRLNLSRKNFFEEKAAGVRFERRIAVDFEGFAFDFDGFASVGIADQEFDPINENQAAALRDGVEINAMVGGTYVMTPTMRVTADIQRLNKDAKAQFFAYTRNQVRLTHTWLLGDGQFLLNHLSYQNDRYDVSDVVIRNIHRHDDIVRYRITYGAPLGFLAGNAFGVTSLWEQLEDITFTGSLEYLRAQSNINNFDYKNWKVQGLFTKTWRF